MRPLFWGSSKEWKITIIDCIACSLTIGLHFFVSWYFTNLLLNQVFNIYNCMTSLNYVTNWCKSCKQILQLFEQGLQEFTWKMKESADFIEQAMALVCVDVHQNLDIVQTNSHEIAEITISWSRGTLDVFSGRDQVMSYSMEELLGMQA